MPRGDEKRKSIRRRKRSRRLCSECSRGRPLVREYTSISSEVCTMAIVRFERNYPSLAEILLSSALSLTGAWEMRHVAPTTTDALWRRRS
ncbi:hypothetical protein EVAR_47391_1 [Eumeta japonica]|uniref:Uncharacterized protein n=1 Tax=Eumeta variegata TaxID=151549 RepID=A0A4C1WWG6_EUMVA|nr:hypothetical protein EVAR_47391_1 [Eumeta japonica]